MNESMIVSVGEVVWDCFPGKKVLGGAPVNVGYHLSCLGHEVLVVSRIGDDELGRNTLMRLEDLSINSAGIQVDELLSTGQVTVSLDEKNEPCFDIVAPAAWDAINSSAAFSLIGGRSYSLVFGTLAQRDCRSRAAIKDLQKRASYRFYDVNLRPPYTTRELVIDSLAVADMVKVNENELQILGGWCDCPEQDAKKLAEQLIEMFQLDAIVVTEGSGGAWIIVGGNYYQADAQPVTVADTVGAGDAFFAALIHGKIQNMPWDRCLREANQRGGYVASQVGATPRMP